MMNTGEIVKFLLNATERDEETLSLAVDLLTMKKISDGKELPLTFADGSTFSLLVD